MSLSVGLALMFGTCLGLLLGVAAVCFSCAMTAPRGLSHSDLRGRRA